MVKLKVTGMTCAACSAHVEKAVKGVEVGVGFASASMCGSEMHDEIFYGEKGDKIYI